MAVGVPDLSPLTDRTLIEVAEVVNATNKGGTALLTPFADKRYRQRAFYLRE